MTNGSIYLMTECEQIIQDNVEEDYPTVQMNNKDAQEIYQRHLNSLKIKKSIPRTKQDGKANLNE